MARPFHVVVLGPPGSGKTTYLAALHHELVSGQIAEGIQFSTGLNDSALLSATYQQMISPQGEWPAGTKADVAMREFTFHCKVQHKVSGFLGRETSYNLPVMDFVYVDYAGEWIPEAHLHPEVSARFEARLDEADVLLGILDGRKLLAHVTDPTPDGSYLRVHLDPVIALMEAQSCPAHIVITKWDLFDRAGWSLEQVQWKLLADAPTFRRFADHRTTRRLLGRTNARARLIPVSTVGRFALPTAEGAMVKDPSASPEPLNVPLPLVAGLVDASNRLLVEAKAEERVARKEGRRARRGRFKGRIDLGSGPLRLDAGQVFAFAFGVVDGTVGAGLAVSRATQRRYRRLRSIELSRVRTAESARFYVGRTFRQMTEGFQLDPRFAGERIGLPEVEPAPEVTDVGAF